MVPRVVCLSAVALALFAPGAAFAQDADPIDVTDVAGVTDDPTLDIDATTVSDDSGSDDASCDDSADDSATDDATVDVDGSDDVADSRVAAIRQDAGDDTDATDDSGATDSSDTADDADAAGDESADYPDGCDSSNTVTATNAVVSKLPKLSFSRLVAGRSVALGTVTVPRKGRIVQQLRLHGIVLGSVNRTVTASGAVHLSLKLGASGRKALKKAGKRKAKVTLRTTLASGAPVITTVLLKS